jgi:hypothetical protein
VADDRYLKATIARLPDAEQAAPSDGDKPSN